jgi:tRNA(fMet)-specific endonuclease VapC
MRRFVLDTGVLLAMLKKHEVFETISNENNLDGEDVVFLLPLAVKTELICLGKKRSWGNAKMQDIDELIKDFIPIYPNDQLIPIYVQTELYSVGKDPKNSHGNSSITMGKNDLWICASSVITNSSFITLDGDFDHLIRKKINGFTYNILSYKKQWNEWKEKQKRTSKTKRGR